MAASWGFVATGAVVAGNVAVPVPAGVQPGDLLILLVSLNNNTATAPASWTQLNSFTNVFESWYKFAGSSESAVNLTSGAASSSAVMIAYRGVGNLDAAGNVGAATNASPATSSHVTTTQADDLVVSLYTVRQGVATWTAGLPANTSVRLAFNPSAAQGGLLIADEDKAATGTTVTRTAGLSQSLLTWAAETVAFTALPFMSFSDDLYF